MRLSAAHVVACLIAILLSAQVNCQCPLKRTSVDLNQPVPTVNAAKVGATFVTGTIPILNGIAPKGRVQICIDNVPAGNSQPTAVDGTYSAAAVKPLAAKQTITAQFISHGLFKKRSDVTSFVVTGDDAAANATTLAAANVKASLNTSQRDSIPWGAAIVGVDVSGASSTDSKAVFLGAAFMDFDLNGDGPTQADWGTALTGQLRIAGMAQPGTLSGSLGTLSAATTYLSAADNATPDKIVQSIEGCLGFGLQLYHHDIAYKAVLTESIIGSFGAITPLSVDQSSPPVYLLTNQILNQFTGQIQGNNPTACAYTTGAPTCYVAFIPQDRTHFYRHYEAGVRLKLYEPQSYTSTSSNSYTFPANADLTIGQNEYVTRGKLSGIVFHFGGIIPLPKYPWIYAFGSMDTTLSGESLKNDAEQLILSPAPSSANLTYLSPSVYTVSVNQPNRDRYRIGFGIDVYHLIQASQTKSK